MVVMGVAVRSVGVMAVIVVAMGGLGMVSDVVGVVAMAVAMIGSVAVMIMMTVGGVRVVAVSVRRVCVMTVGVMAVVIVMRRMSDRRARHGAAGSGDHRVDVGLGHRRVGGLMIRLEMAGVLHGAELATALGAGAGGAGVTGHGDDQQQGQERQAGADQLLGLHRADAGHGDRLHARDGERLERQ